MRERAAKRNAASEEQMAMRKLGEEDYDSVSEPSVHHVERDLERGREKVPLPILTVTTSP